MPLTGEKFFPEDFVRTIRVIRWFMSVALLVGLATAVFSPRASAQQGGLTLPMNLAQMVDESEFVVLGRVISAKAEKHPQYQNLDTVVITLSIVNLTSPSFCTLSVGREVKMEIPV